MKRFLFLLIAFVALVASANAQYQSDTTHYQAHAVNFKFDNDHSYRGWQSCDVPIDFIFDSHRVIIYTTKQHIIDYGEVYKKEYKDYTYYTTFGNDTNYSYIKVEWFVYNSGTTIIKLTTKTLTFKYVIGPYKDESL